MVNKSSYWWFLRIFSHWLVEYILTERLWLAVSLVWQNTVSRGFLLRKCGNVATISRALTEGSNVDMSFFLDVIQMTRTPQKLRKQGHLSQIKLSFAGTIKLNNKVLHVLKEHQSWLSTHRELCTGKFSGWTQHQVGTNQSQVKIQRASLRYNMQEPLTWQPC